MKETLTYFVTKKIKYWCYDTMCQSCKTSYHCQCVCEIGWKLPYSALLKHIRLLNKYLILKQMPQLIL
jgi:hypothetical protein